MRAWSLYSHSGENPYAGHAGYDDAAGRHYSYDSDVANHRRVSNGDLVVLRGPGGSLGIGFIAMIDEAPATKTHRRCPTCNTSQLERRKTVQPEFRCTNGHTFAVPLETRDPVTQYRADFAPGYLDYDALTPNDLEALCMARSQQNAIRELELDRTLEVLRSRRIYPAFIASDAPT